MVAVLHAAPRTGAPEASAAWLDGLRGTYPPDEIAAFAGTLDYARTRCGDACTRDGEPLIDRGAGAASILAGLSSTPPTVVGALFVGPTRAGAFDAEDVTARFGAKVATLVGGVARMDEVRALPQAGDAERARGAGGALRKMLLAMVEDIRVVLVKLAERAGAALPHDRRRGASAMRRAR